MQSTSQQQLYQQQKQRIQQAQQLQQQRMYQKSQMGDPTLSFIKDEFVNSDPTDPFSLSNTEFDILGGQNRLLSPLSTSPLDGNEYDDIDLTNNDLTSGSLSNSPFGTPGLQQYYSMSMPARATANAFGSNSFPQSTSTASGNFTFKHPNMSVMRGDEDSLKQLDLLNEKRRRRRESHNAVERRRRDHINEKIQELSYLLPVFAEDAQTKPNKGTILKRSVDYLRHMQAFATKQLERTRELEMTLARVCSSTGIDVNQLCLSLPLGTPIEIPIMTSNNMETMEDFEDERD